MRRAAAVALAVCVGSVLATIAVYLAHATEWLIRGTISHLLLADVLGVPGPIGAIPLCFLVPFVAFAALYVFFALWTRAIQKDIDAHPNR